MLHWIGVGEAGAPAVRSAVSSRTDLSTFHMTEANQPTKPDHLVLGRDRITGETKSARHRTRSMLESERRTDTNKA